MSKKLFVILLFLFSIVSVFSTSIVHLTMDGEFMYEIEGYELVIGTDYVFYSFGDESIDEVFVYFKDTEFECERGETCSLTFKPTEIGELELDVIGYIDGVKVASQKFHIDIVGEGDDEQEGETDIDQEKDEVIESENDSLGSESIDVGGSGKSSESLFRGEYLRDDLTCETPNSYGLSNMESGFDVSYCNNNYCNYGGESLDVNGEFYFSYDFSGGNDVGLDNLGKNHGIHINFDESNEEFEVYFSDEDSQLSSFLLENGGVEIISDSHLYCENLETIYELYSTLYKEKEESIDKGVNGDEEKSQESDLEVISDDCSEFQHTEMSGSGFDIKYCNYNYCNSGSSEVELKNGLNFKYDFSDKSESSIETEVLADSKLYFKYDGARKGFDLYYAEGKGLDKVVSESQDLVNPQLSSCDNLYLLYENFKDSLYDFEGERKNLEDETEIVESNFDILLVPLSWEERNYSEFKFLAEESKKAIISGLGFNSCQEKINIIIPDKANYFSHNEDIWYCNVPIKSCNIEEGEGLNSFKIFQGGPLASMASLKECGESYKRNTGVNVDRVIGLSQESIKVKAEECNNFDLILDHNGWTYEYYDTVISTDSNTVYDDLKNSLGGEVEVNNFVSCRTKFSQENLIEFRHETNKFDVKSYIDEQELFSNAENAIFSLKKGVDSISKKWEDLLNLETIENLSEGDYEEIFDMFDRYEIYLQDFVDYCYREEDGKTDLELIRDNLKKIRGEVVIFEVPYFDLLDSLVTNASDKWALTFLTCTDVNYDLKEFKKNVYFYQSYLQTAEGEEYKPTYFLGIETELQSKLDRLIEVSYSEK